MLSYTGMKRTRNSRSGNFQPPKGAATSKSPKPSGDFQVAERTGGFQPPDSGYTNVPTTITPSQEVTFNHAI